MIIDGSSTSAWANSSSAAAGHRSTASASQSAVASRGKSSLGDTAEISNEARGLALTLNTNTVQPTNGYSLANTNAKAASNTGLRKYTNIGLGAGSTNLTAMNYSRKQLSDRINGVLKTAGIELKDDEKISISVNSKNEIVVGGIKDKEKARKIQEALNEDKKLATQMRNHVAAGKINENAAKQEAYEQYLSQTGQAVPEDIDEMFTSPAIRSYVIDQYLSENAGLGLSDLALDYDEEGNASIVGGDETLKALLSEDQQLGVTIGKILENGETSSDFDVAFEFANGAVTDPHSQAMAESKVKGIKEKLLRLPTGGDPGGVADRFREVIDNNGGIDDAVFEKALARGFSILVKSNGEFEIAGLDDLDPKYRDTLKNLVTKALEEWRDDKDGVNAMDAGGQRVANFADVYDTLLQEHQFEHGDTEEFPHELEINFAAGGSTKMVSPEADEAQHAKNEELAGELGEALRQSMSDSGIDISNMEMEIDQAGKITVKGGASEIELKKAQDFVDQFMKDAKVGGLNDEEKHEDGKASREAGKERREIHSGKKDDEPTAANVEAWANGADKKEEKAEGDDEKSLSSKELRQKRINEAWEKVVPSVFDGVFSMGLGKGVSDVKPDRYSDTGGGDAANLYRRLLNGLDKFHEKPKSFSYAM